ncbi:HCCA isomerase/glutathione S-transferase kappa [Lophium mytilinum]|uniref:Glutathione S-transferase kappa n=1 Tax=Lophium mytilinum TaxID=390894 RepID=A0A6A6R6Q5_9PEZI|nr:HCCA isomerase/glutathione S-transferase kappa [Lophium mytilinum]
MAKPKITLYVDIVSPFAYLGFYALQNFPVFKQCEITYIPIFLGGLMKACGNTAPINVKNKDKWINLERARWCRQFNVPISENAPPGFPINTILIQRTLTALSVSHPDLIPAAIAALYQAFWVEFDHPEKPENLLRILSAAVGEAAATEAVEKSGSKEVKDGLMKRTEESFAEGAFGLPWFIVTNSKGETESFWGFDHLGQVVDHLGLAKPTDGGWKAML